VEDLFEDNENDIEADGLNINPEFGGIMVRNEIRP